MIFQFKVNQRFVQNRSHCSLFQENLLAHIILQLLRWKSSFWKTLTTFYPALLSPASMPLLRTTTCLHWDQLFSQPSLLPQLLSLDRQPYTTSSLSPQYSVNCHHHHHHYHHHYHHHHHHHHHHHTVIDGYRSRLVVSKPAAFASLLLSGQRGKHLRHWLPF